METRSPPPLRFDVRTYRLLRRLERARWRREGPRERRRRGWRPVKQEKRPIVEGTVAGEGGVSRRLRGCVRQGPMAAIAGWIRGAVEKPAAVMGAVGIWRKRRRSKLGMCDRGLRLPVTGDECVVRGPMRFVNASLGAVSRVYAHFQPLAQSKAQCIPGV